MKRTTTQSKGLGALTFAQRRAMILTMGEVHTYILIYMGEIHTHILIYGRAHICAETGDDIDDRHRECSYMHVCSSMHVCIYVVCM